MAKIVWLALVVLLLAVVILIIPNPATIEPVEWIEKSDDGQGAVTVTASPMATQGSMTVRLAINTHSVDISGFDVLGNTRLVMEDKILVPKNWQEVESSSHHMSGMLVFENPGRVKMELVVKNLAGVGERRIEWER